MYRDKHKTEIAAMKCMDGRINLSVITKTPLGILQPWRNIGGIFRLGWPHYRDTILEWMNYAEGQSRDCLVLTTYHFSRGQNGEDAEKVKLRGCAGHNYNTDQARQCSLDLKNEFDYVFGLDRIYTIQCGIETDSDAMILHGHNGGILDLASYNPSSDFEIYNKLAELYPNIPETVLNDFFPLVKNNLEHIAEVKAGHRQIIDMEHQEMVLSFGRGFDWLHDPNFALIVGPYDLDLETPLAKAAGLLQQNIDTGRVNAEDGMVLLVSSPYREEGYLQKAAELKAKVLTEFASNVVKKHQPKLWENMKIATAICDMDTRKLHIL